MVVGPIHEDIKVFNKHQVSDHLYTLLLSMVQSSNIAKEQEKGPNYCEQSEAQVPKAPTRSKKSSLSYMEHGVSKFMERPTGSKM